MKALPLAVAGVLLVSGCSGPADPAAPVTVLAAASLTEALDELAVRFDVDLVISYGGSSALAEQIVSGAPADLFFSANETTMQSVVDAGLAADPEVLVTNVLAIAVPAGNPAGVTGLADLADPALTIALCDPSVPCGSAAERLFELAGLTAAPDTLEDDVKAALTKVALGEVDAAVVYITDIRAATGVDAIAIAGAARATNRYPVALLTEARNPAGARAFLEFLRSDEAREVFTDAGFGIP